MKREIFVGNVGIGANHRVSIQSMCNSKTSDVLATLKQINELYSVGCEIVRVALPDKESIKPFNEICQKSPLPVIADIHFSHKLAIAAIENGAKAIRINPGNIGSKERVKKIIEVAKDYEIAIRIGVNMGSIDKKFKGLKAHEAMVSSALDHLDFFEKMSFNNIKLSLKSSSVLETVKAYKLIDKKCDYPLHIGVTEAGTSFGGTIKSSIGIGALLLDGIGNTLRVSLTDDVKEEIKVAKEILRYTGLRKEGIELISCPTCARTSVNLIEKAKEVEEKIKDFNTKKEIKVAVMGCEVNGPGEAKDANIGLAFSKGKAFIFKEGEIISSCDSEKAVDILIEELKKII